MKILRAFLCGRVVTQQVQWWVKSYYLIKSKYFTNLTTVDNHKYNFIFSFYKSFQFVEVKWHGGSA